MSVLNSTIIERAWMEGSNDFQQRIPNPSINSYANVVEELFQPYNNDLFNQFTGLLNGLMGTYIESKLFENPLRDLKKPAAQWGNTERHVAIKYLKAHTYRNDSETLLKVEKPEYREFFYSVGTPRRYEFSWSRYELQRVFAADGYGFDDLLSGTLTQMYSSDNYDEMNIMIQMFAEGDRRMGGLFRHNLSALPTDEATGKELLTAIRTYAGRMKFPTMLYNHIDVPVFESGDTLVLWVTPDVSASLDVNTLSAVFQLDKADIKYRIITIPEFPLPNVVAALTSEDFIYCRDVNYGVEPPFYNPENLTYKYYLHHAQMIGVNPVANCVLFTVNEQNTAIPTYTVVPQALTISAERNTAKPGDEIQLALDLTGTVSLDGTQVSETSIAVEPDSAIFDVRASYTADNQTIPFDLNSATRVDRYGVLHIQKSGFNSFGSDDELTIIVTANATYTNPSGATPEIAPATVSITVSFD